MPEFPVPYNPAIDVEMAPLQATTDERVQVIAEAGAEFQQLIRGTLPAHPHVEQAVRLVDLAVRAAETAAQDSPPAATGEPPE